MLTFQTPSELKPVSQLSMGVWRSERCVRLHYPPTWLQLRAPLIFRHLFSQLALVFRLLSCVGVAILVCIDRVECDVYCDVILAFELCQRILFAKVFNFHV